MLVTCPGYREGQGINCQVIRLWYREVIARQVGGLWDGARRPRGRDDRPSVPVPQHNLLLAQNNQSSQNQDQVEDTPGLWAGASGGFLLGLIPKKNRTTLNRLTSSS